MFNQAEFRAAMARKGVTKKEVAQELGVSEVTLWRKLNKDGDFSREEINKLIDCLQIDDPSAVFFAPELTETQEVET